MALYFDFETTGIDDKHNSLLSIGFLNLASESVIKLQSAEYHYLNAGQQIQDSSVVVNHILWQSGLTEIKISLKCGIRTIHKVLGISLAP